MRIFNTVTWLNFIVQMTNALAWPVFVLLVMLVFRKQLVTAAQQLRSIRFPDGTEAKFGAQLKTAEETSKDLEPASPEIASANDERLKKLLEMAEFSPTGAIVEAWKDVEFSARNYAEASEIPMKSNKDRPYFSLQKILEQNELLPKAEIQTFRQLRMLRNRAAHSTDAEINAGQAAAYVRVSDRLVDAINELKNSNS